jgi:hypothetical protein
MGALLLATVLAAPQGLVVGLAGLLPRGRGRA